MLLWGKGISPETISPGSKALFRVAVGVAMAASLAMAMAFGRDIGKHGLVAWMFGLIAVMAGSFILLLVLKPTSPKLDKRNVVHFAVNVMAVLSSSLGLLFATLLVERTALIMLPVEDSLIGGGQRGASSAVSLRGVEASKVGVNLDGLVRWSSSELGPSGTATLQITVAVGTQVNTHSFSTVLPPEKGEALTSQLVVVDVPNDQQAPGGVVSVSAAVVGCQMNRPTPVDPAAGQFANCYYDFRVNAKPM